MWLFVTEWLKKFLQIDVGGKLQIKAKLILSYLMGTQNTEITPLKV